MNPTEPTSQEQDAMNAGIQFGMQALQQIPRGDPAAMEAHITGVLVVFMGALWGSYGTEYARGFLEAQLRGMEPDVPHERFTEPRVQ